MMTSKNYVDQLYPDARVRIMRVYEDVKRILMIYPRPTQALRTFEEQQILFEKGRVKNLQGIWRITDPKAVVTKAPPGLSLHAYGLAIDTCFAGQDPYLDSYPPNIRLDTWKKFGEIGRAHGFTWGGDWNGNGTRDPGDFDFPHLQISYGLDVREMLDLYSNAPPGFGVQAVWATIDKIRGVEIGKEWRHTQPQGET